MAIYPVHPDDLTILDACAGYGMLGEAVILGLESIGLRGRIVAHVERDAAAAAALVARMEGSPVDFAPVWDDLGTFDGKPWRGCVDIACAGLPCPAYSLAGKRIGNDDARAWGEDGESGPVPQFLRIVSECRPAVVFCENVPAWVTAGWFRRFGDELSRLGYEIEEPLFLAASDVGAPHERERVFVLAHRLADAQDRRRWIGTSRGRPNRSDASGTDKELAGCSITKRSPREWAQLWARQSGTVTECSDHYRQQRSSAITCAADNQLAYDQSGRRSPELGQPGGASEAIGNAPSNNEELAQRPGGGQRIGGESSGGNGQPHGSEPQLAGADGAGREGPEQRPARDDARAAARGSASQRDRELGDAECFAIEAGSDDAAGVDRSIEGRAARAELRRGELSPSLWLFPPGRGDESNPDHPDWWAWAAVAAMAPAAMPRVEHHVPALADGMARADELRIGGNGVVPLAAAYALATLLDAARNRE